LSPNTFFSTQQLGENAPETADLYFSYGRALLENAIVQSSVLVGKEQRQDGNQEDGKGIYHFATLEHTVQSTLFSPPLSASGSGSAPILSFSGDAEDMDDGEDHAVDLLGQAAAVEEEAGEAEESEEEEDGDGDGEPEDDFNAAWEVLDLARAIYDKQKNEDDDEEVRLKLADTYIALGDVSLETGLFFSLSSY
jgi:HAT1-interacting factor 1